MDIDPVVDSGIKIAPSVLIIFIENAFKHAKNTLSRGIFIRIALKINGDLIRFEVFNSYDEENGKDLSETESSGLGLNNTIRRLKLLYADNYELKQFAENGIYHLILTLQIKQSEQ